MRAPAFLSSESAPVAICFEDRSITILFARLLDSMGVPIRLLNEISELEERNKVITERQFYDQLREGKRKDSLVIGLPQALSGVEGVGLSQPLTEEKIEAALARFLEVPLQ
ncbi:MAG: hypothetical protein KDD64_04955 [Bdellovibrionales bacterium]|nr:hypothetical protein [Bdellovibrionales bacterium]